MVHPKRQTIAILTITQYRTWAIPFAFLSMVLFRLPLMLNKKIRFWRLMGSGKNGTFDKVPDLKQWAILSVFSMKHVYDIQQKIYHEPMLKWCYGRFVAGWIWLFCKNAYSYLLHPVEGRGTWDGKEVFGPLARETEFYGTVAVLTRATIRVGKLKRFWEHVPQTAAEMAVADGFITSYGVGEWPWVKQATFSIWKSKDHMKQFAYKSMVHRDVIRKTHAEDWYSEEMFVRFRMVQKFLQQN